METRNQQIPEKSFFDQPEKHAWGSPPELITERVEFFDSKAAVPPARMETGGSGGMVFCQYSAGVWSALSRLHSWMMYSPGNCPGSMRSQSSSSGGWKER